MERTYAAAVFPSTVLGRARNAAAIATACGLALAARHGAALGQHVVARAPAHAPAAITTSPAAATVTTAFSGSAAACADSDTITSPAAATATAAFAGAAAAL
jgi:hypothetical protein